MKINPVHIDNFSDCAHRALTPTPKNYSAFALSEAGDINHPSAWNSAAIG
jgi:hypothetical protein